MSKIISYYWYTLKATLIIGYIFFNIRGKSKIISLRKAIRTKEEARRLKEFYLAARCLIKFIRDAKKLNCVSTRVSFPALGTLFPNLIGMVWISEKMGMSVKFIHTTPSDPRDYVPEFFENPVLCPNLCPPENFAQIEQPISNIKYLEEINFDFSGAMLEFATHRLSSEYGHKIISMLIIKQEFQQQADEWYHNNIKGKCIGAHYRGTDAMRENRSLRISDYISYLKRVLDEESYIFVCSDQAQFITQMNAAFPGRVIARDIKRSYTYARLHSKGCSQQAQDAFIDMLVLAKTELIYTIGSRFVDCTRFFNPAIKIISLDGRHRHKIGSKHIPNYLPIPEADFVEKMKQEAIKGWNAPTHL